MMRQVECRFRDLWLRVVDPKRIPERAGERVVFNHLRACRFLDGFENKRLLEVGPQHGQDSLLLIALKPSELVLIDLPEQAAIVREWLPQVSRLCRTQYVEGNLLYLSQEQYRQLGTFDLIWCLGVLCHNFEQLRFLKRLFDLTHVNGCVVIECPTTSNKRLERLNVVEIHWPNTFGNLQTITHLPSRRALKSWLEMVGFTEVRLWDVYSKALARQRAVLTGRKTGTSQPYVSHVVSRA
jgi:SAM-dependent methyltransferase